jgi:preprotein translocase subunit Sec63
MSYSDRIDPYSVLNISPDSSIEECRSAYKRLATKNNRRIRQRACLAYDILCNKEKYIKEGNYYRVKKKIVFIILLLET